MRSRQNSISRQSSVRSSGSSTHAWPHALASGHSRHDDDSFSRQDDDSFSRQDDSFSLSLSEQGLYAGAVDWPRELSRERAALGDAALPPPPAGANGVVDSGATVGGAGQLFSDAPGKALAMADPRRRPSRSSSRDSSPQVGDNAPRVHAVTRRECML